jgi:hypothetical protein
MPEVKRVTISLEQALGPVLMEKHDEYKALVEKMPELERLKLTLRVVDVIVRNMQEPPCPKP